MSNPLLNKVYAPREVFPLATIGTSGVDALAATLERSWLTVSIAIAVVYVPIFAEGELVAFAEATAHWADIGGKSAPRQLQGVGCRDKSGEWKVGDVKPWRRG